jgi:hypothetical protein
MPKGRFWQEKGLGELSAAEWDALCDGCARCCLVKLEDDDTAEVHYTDVACRLLDAGKCQCSDYQRRAELVADCVVLTPDSIGDLTWMPPTCAYRLVAEGKDLYWWHPLVSGDPEAVHTAGVSVRGRIVVEERVSEDALQDHIVDWPDEDFAD